MLSSKRHDQALQFALERLQQADLKPYIHAIYLYGSCARGMQKYTSDVDLFLFLKPDTPSRLIRMMKTEVNSGDYTLPEVELKISLTDQFSESKTFSGNIERDAIKLWEQEKITSV